MSLSKLMRAARESIDAVEDLTPEDNAEALGDTGLTADVLEEVQAPADDLDAGMTDVEGAEVAAGALDNTAVALTDSLEDGGQGVDPVAAGLASDQIQAAVERYSLSSTHARPARESFATSSGARAATRSLAKEAEDTAKGLRERAMEAIKKAVAWLKDLLATVMDKAVRLEKRAKALVKQAGEVKVAGGGELKLNSAFLGGKSATDVAKSLAKLPVAFDKLAEIANDSTGSAAVNTDINPDMVGNVSMKMTADGNKLRFEKEAAEAKEGKTTALSSGECVAVAQSVTGAVASIRNQKKHFDAITAKSLGKLDILKNGDGVTGRAEALANVTSVTRAAGAVVSVVLGVSSRLLDMVAKSLAVKPAGEEKKAA